MFVDQMLQLSAAVMLLTEQNSWFTNQKHGELQDVRENLGNVV